MKCLKRPIKNHEDKVNKISVNKEEREVKSSYQIMTNLLIVFIRFYQKIIKSVGIERNETLEIYMATRIYQSSKKKKLINKI